jgi:hypothetical protein
VPVVETAALAVLLVVAGALHAASRLVIMAMDQSLLPVIMFLLFWGFFFILNHSFFKS